MPRFHSPVHHPLIRIVLPVFVAGLLTVTALDRVVAAAPWGGVPVVDPVMPIDSQGTNQTSFNNLAWQQFITLNWVADPNNPGRPDPNVPPADFGTASDTRPVVWESYKESSEVFRPNAEPPTPWKATRTLPAALLSMKQNRSLKATSKFGVKGLFALSKFVGGPLLDLSEFQEAFAGGAWLTAQPKMNNYLTLFEKRLNEDEFDYINNNKLYDATVQSQFALTQGINLPDGSIPNTDGAIEIKAGWIQLDDPSLWPLFKTSQAYVSYPIDGGGFTPPKLVTVGLVALHIIRKTENAQQFAWSTFEHVYNAPSTTDLQNQTLKPWYTYSDPSCKDCPQNQNPASKKLPYSSPVQVVRTTPISTTTSNDIEGLNKSTWATIAKSNPNSVFLNYQLVNVLWPNNNTSILPGATVPLTDGNAQPPQVQQPVANAVLETYNQSINCLACHVNAPIASTTGQQLIKIMKPGKVLQKVAGDAPPALASDYSFLFSEAQAPASASGEKVKKEH